MLTGKHALTTKQLLALKKDLHLCYPELAGYNFVKRTVSLQLWVPG